MGFRVRKSSKIAPAVRLSVSTSGVGASVGVPGARYGVRSSGRRTRTVGIPGAGVSHVSTSTNGSRSRSAAPAVREQRLPAPANGPKPGWLAPRGEKELYKAVNSGTLDIAQLDRIAAEHPEWWLPASTLGAIRRTEVAPTDDSTVAQLQAVFAHHVPPEGHTFVTRYLAGVCIGVGIAPGVTARLPLSRDLIGLTLAEALQARFEVDSAIGVVERLDPSAYVAVSLAELYCQAARHDQVIDLTNGIDNTDDATALLNVYRGIAFAHTELYEAARQAFREALRSKKRPPEVRYLALRHRAEVYVAEGKKAQARQDLERILAGDASVEGVSARLQELGG